MAHVAGTPPPHSLGPMPPHAWSTEHQLSNSHSHHRRSLPPYTASTMQSLHPWHSTHQDSVHPPIPPAPSDLAPPTDPPDHVNADTVFRDLLNLRISSDSSSDPLLSQHSYVPHQAHTVPSPIGLTLNSIHPDVFPHSDPEPDINNIADRLDFTDSHLHPEQSGKHYSHHTSSLPLLRHQLEQRLRQQQQDPPVSDSAPLQQPYSYGHSLPISSEPLVNRRHSPHGGLFHTTSIADQITRNQVSSRSRGAINEPHSGPRIKNDLYKTEICRSFAENGGFCKYGSKCQFAHGDEELRPVRRHPRYKTKLCRNFVNNGSCPYDTRCRFIHANDLPYASAPSLPLLHQNSVSGPMIGGRPGVQIQYDNALGSGKEYADHLRRVLGSNPAAPAVSATATGESSAPLTSPLASPPAEREPMTSPLLVPRDGRASPIGYVEPQRKNVTPSATAPLGYQTGSTVFHEYPDNAFSQPFIPLVAGDSKPKLNPSVSANSSNDVHVRKVRDTSTSEIDELNVVFGSSDEEVNKSRNVLIGNGRSSIPKPRETTDQAKAGQDVSEHTQDVSSAELATMAQKSSRGRLPVFRNITSGGDSI